ncbi:MAG: hypothetical protein IT578_01635, partial [Verrucomicrobiae bacterium]|nr:hypothetical protein [Verrucomicrobiae bacterium]
LSNNVSFAANSVLGAAGSGDLTFQGAYADLGASARTLTISNARVAVANSFTGVVELTKAGPGALALSGVNALGGLKLQSGDLRLEGGSTKILGAPAVVIGNTLGGDAALLIQGGSLAYSSNSTFFVGSGAGVTGTVIVAEGGALYLTNRSGLFTSSSTVFGEGGGFGSLIVSGGVVRTERTSDAGKLFVGGRQFSPGSGQMLIYGGSVDLSEALYVGHTDSTGLVLIAGGTLTVTNMAVLPAGVDYAKIGSGSGGMGTMVISNGGRFVSDLVAVGFPGTGLLLVSEGGTLELKRNNYLKLGIGGGTGAISNLHGGTIRFTTNAPDTSYTSANAFMSDSTLEFQGVDAAALNENAVVNFAHQGQNTLRLNSATNAAIAYAFTNGGRFAVLELAGVNPSWQGPSLLIGAGGELRISNATAGVNATLTNAGTIRAVNAHVTYSSPVVLGGGYLSDPSTNTFLSNLTVTSSGYLQGGAGDRFVFQRDLILQSTNTTQFDLSTAAIQFSSGSATNHVLNLTGGGATDLGSNWISVAQLATNFAVGRLTLSSGNSLQITGGAANAFYIGMLDLNGLGTNDLRDVLDLDVNLYYDPNAIGNEYLDGLIYDYAEWNGALIPLAIPEPSVFLALGAGLFLLALGRSRKRKD